MIKTSLLTVVALFALALWSASSPSGQDTCPEEPPLQHWTGAGTITCPCFVVGEHAGAVFEAPAAHYPIEILRVGIGWGSQAGGAQPSLEQSIHIFGAGLPNPGSPLFTFDGPVLTDGFINEFDLEPEPGEIIIDNGPFSVTLEFANANVGDPLAPSVVHDGNGCQPGKNLVYAIPGGWYDACALGVSGDWLFHVIYRQTNCGSGGTVYCTAKLNSLFCLPAIGGSGTPSVSSPQPFDVTVDNVLNNKNGILFYGFGRFALPFQGGWLCVMGPIKRTPVQSTGGNPPPNDCSGQLSMDFNAWIQGGYDPALISGATVNIQGWSRDPAEPGSKTSLSDGLEFTISP